MQLLRLINDLHHPKHHRLCTNGGKQVQRVLPTTTHTTLQLATVTTTVTATAKPPRVSETSANETDRYRDGRMIFTKVGDTFTDKTDLPSVA